MPTRGNYVNIPAIFRDYDLYKDSPIAREWLSNDNGGIYYVKSDGVSIVDVGGMILKNHIQEGYHENLSSTGTVHFNNGLKVKVTGNLFGSDIISEPVYITDNGDNDIYNISISNSAGSILSVINGGTGHSTWSNIGAIYTADRVSLTSGVLPIQCGGTGRNSWSKGALYTTGASISSSTLPIAYGGTGVTSIANGAVSVTSGTMRGGVLPIGYGGTGKSSFGSGLLYSNGSTFSIFAKINGNINDGIPTTTVVNNLIWGPLNNHMQTIGCSSYHGHAAVMDWNPGWNLNQYGYCESDKYLPTGNGFVVGTGIFNNITNAILSTLNGKVGTDGSIKWMALLHAENSATNAYTYIHVSLNSNQYVLGAMSSGANKTNVFQSFGYTQTSVGIHVWVSDARLKENIVDTKINGMEKIMQIKHKQFNFIGVNNTVSIGYIAQDMEKIDRGFTTHVANDENNINDNDDRTFTYQVNESGIIPVITKGMQEMYEENQQLKTKVETLEKEIELIKKTLGI